MLSIEGIHSMTLTPNKERHDANALEATPTGLQLGRIRPG
jgi:hypothetical protein